MKKKYGKNEKPKYYDNNITQEIEHLIINKRYEEALVVCEGYLKNYPNDDKGPFCYARIQLLLGNKEEALRLAREAYERCRFYSRHAIKYATLEYAKILIENGSIEEAISLYEKAIAEDVVAKSSVTRTEYLKALCMNKEYEKALEKADEFLKENYNDTVLYRKASILFQMDRFEEALAVFKQVHLDGKLSLQQRVDFYMGRCNVTMYFKTNIGQYLLDAEQNLKDALNVKNDVYYVACSELVNVYGIIGNHEELLKYAQIAIDNQDIFIDREKTMNKIYGAMAISYINKKQYEKAMHYNNLITNEIERQSNMIRYYYRTKQFDKYLENANYVLSNENPKGFLHYYCEYICVLLRIGKYDEALYMADCIKEELPIQFYERVVAFIRNKKGEEPLNYRYYTSRQIANYSFEDAVDHVCNGHLLSSKEYLFNDRESVEKALLDARAAIATMDHIPDEMLDRYVVTQEGLAQDKYGSVSGMVVIAVPETNNIITMYPISKCVSDYEEEYQSKPAKRLSQIEKFNQKYGKK